MIPCKIVIANNKGGVGKTTTAINLAGMLEATGEKVLVIDLDPQSNLTMGFAGYGIQPVNHAGELMEGSRTVTDAIVELTPNLHIIPASHALVKSEMEVDKNCLRKHEVLRNKLSSVQDYNFIILDTQPNLEALLTLNGLVYADYVIVPAEPEPFAGAGISQILPKVAQIRAECLNPFLRVMGYLVTKFGNTKVHRGYVNDYKSVFHGAVFTTMIRKNTALTESAKDGKPISQKRAFGYIDYSRLTEEVLERIGHAKAA